MFGSLGHSSRFPQIPSPSISLFASLGHSSHTSGIVSLSWSNGKSGSLQVAIRESIYIILSGSIFWVLQSTLFSEHESKLFSPHEILHSILSLYAVILNISFKLESYNLKYIWSFKLLSRYPSEPPLSFPYNVIPPVPKSLMCQ